MATPRSQRIAIWIITVVMAVGAVGAYFVMILANNNDMAQQTKQEDFMAQYEQQMKEANAKRAASSKPLDGYAAEPFDAAAATELKTEDLRVGEGKEVYRDSTIEANYFGWTADGKIFDSTNQNGTVTPASFSIAPGQVIEGWTEGLAGAREGSVRKLIIPGNMAYEPGAAQQLRPEGPLVFIVEVVSVK